MIIIFVDNAWEIIEFLHLHDKVRDLCQEKSRMITWTNKRVDVQDTSRFQKLSRNLIS